LIITNESAYDWGNSLLEMGIKAKVDQLFFPRNNPNFQDKIQLLRKTWNDYDAVIVTTNYGWPTEECRDILGNIVKQMVDHGIGVITSVFCGCSWVETLGGDYQKHNCNPIVPNVVINNTVGSQGIFTGDFPQDRTNHMLLNNLKVDSTNYTIALGKAHDEGNVISTLISKENDKYPFIVELKKWPGTILSINARLSLVTSIIPHALLYVSRKT